MAVPPGEEQAKAKESSSRPPAHMLELLMLRQQVAALQAEKQLRLDAQTRAAAEWDQRELRAMTPHINNAAACILRRICSIDGFHGSSANTLARAMSMDNVNDMVSMANAVIAAYDGEPPCGPSLHALGIKVAVLRSVVDRLPCTLLPKVELKSCTAAVHCGTVATAASECTWHVGKLFW